MDEGDGTTSQQNIPHPPDLRRGFPERCLPDPKKVRGIEDFAFPLAWALLHIR
jgi:hypothetical protein